MLRRLVNEVRITLSIRTTGPLLVKSGQPTVSGPDMTPIRTYRNGEWQVFIPGSSLKGVIRSQSERIVRTINPVACCNPFLKFSEAKGATTAKYFEVSCGDRFERRKKTGRERITSNAVYAQSCAVCRIYGSTEFGSRFLIGDAYRVSATDRCELRDGVGIDRLTGGAARSAKFELQAVSTGTIFQTELFLRNFECWQLGLLLAVLQDMKDGLMQIGGCKSRGFGSVVGEVDRLTICQFSMSNPDGLSQLLGLGHYLQDNSYGTNSDDVLQFLPPLQVKRHGVRVTAEVPTERLTSLTESSMSTCAEVITAWKIPTEMRDPSPSVL